MQLLERCLPFTRAGREQLSAEIAWLENLGQQLLAEWARAPEPRWSLLDAERSAIVMEIRVLTAVLTGGVTVGDGDELVAVGSRVTISHERGEETLTITGPLSANPHLGCISFESPLGRALIGRMTGDEVEVNHDGERRRLRITAITSTEAKAVCGSHGP